MWLIRASSKHVPNWTLQSIHSNTQIEQKSLTYKRNMCRIQVALLQTVAKNPLFQFSAPQNKY